MLGQQDHTQIAIAGKSQLKHLETALKYAVLERITKMQDISSDTN